MSRPLAVALLILIAAGGSASAQPAPFVFERAAYVTCREAHAMAPDARRAVATQLAAHAARYRGVTIPDDERGAHIGFLVRGGCTLSPDAYLFTVVDRAIQAEAAKLPKR